MGLKQICWIAWEITMHRCTAIVVMVKYPLEHTGRAGYDAGENRGSPESDTLAAVGLPQVKIFFNPPSYFS